MFLCGSPIWLHDVVFNRSWYVFSFAREFSSEPTCIAAFCIVYSNIPYELLAFVIVAIYRVNNAALILLLCFSLAHVASFPIQRPHSTSPPSSLFKVPSRRHKTPSNISTSTPRRPSGGKSPSVVHAVHVSILLSALKSVVHAPRAPGLLALGACM